MTISEINSFVNLRTGTTAATWQTPSGGDNPVFYSAGSSIIRNSGGSISQGGTATTDWVGAYTFPDSSNNYLIWNCPVPSGKTGIVGIDLIIQGDGIGNNAYLEFTTAKIDVISGGAIQSDTTQTKTAYAITANGEFQILAAPADSFNGLTAITDDKVIAVQCGRMAADALDTHNTTLNVVGLVIEWS